MSDEIIKYGDCEFSVPCKDTRLRKEVMEKVKRAIDMTGEVPKKVLIPVTSNTGNFYSDGIWVDILTFGV